MVITLDGPSGTGKSTLAKLVAQKLNFKFLNSGMIYRAICYHYLSEKILPSDIVTINNSIQNLNIKILFIEGNQHIIINNKDITSMVSTTMVNQNVSLFSQILSIRHKTLELQRTFAKFNSIVIEGRDIGTEVFPNAEYKFYVVCDILVRAKRRFNDLKKYDKSITLDEVIKSLENRDFLDTNRKHSPLTKPKNAIVIDTSTKTIDECVDLIINYVKK